MTAFTRRQVWHDHCTSARAMSATIARAALRLRPPFTVMLVTLVVLITAATAVAIGGLAWREQRARSAAIVAGSAIFGAKDYAKAIAELRAKAAAAAVIS